PKLGLEERNYDELTQKIDAVIHGAALTNLFVNYRRIQPINEGGTQNIIEFTLKTQNKYLCHISTHTVMGNLAFDKNLVYRETDFDLNQKFDHMNYQKTKFLAEKMVREAAAQGLKWNIMRPGQIFGDSETGLYPQGHSNVSGLFYDIFKTVIETGVALDSTAHFDVVPVDYVSRGVLFLGLISPKMYETYHLTNPDTKGYSEVIRVLKEEGYNIHFVDETQYKELLFNNKLFCDGVEYKSPTTSAFKWWFKKEGFSFEQSCITGSEYTQEALKQFGIKCPPVDAKLIGLYIDRGIEQNYFPKRNLPKATQKHSEARSRTETTRVFEETSL
ncbi:MAG: SDR family oxidoreductase, partial [Bdellovibrionales bacterium]|nr:SDR family oxidoreductase [Bdellovibrionales bacterium]